MPGRCQHSSLNGVSSQPSRLPPPARARTVVPFQPPGMQAGTGRDGCCLTHIAFAPSLDCSTLVRRGSGQGPFVRSRVDGSKPAHTSPSKGLGRGERTRLSISAKTVDTSMKARSLLKACRRTTSALCAPRQSEGQCRRVGCPLQAACFRTEVGAACWHRCKLSTPAGLRG